MVILDDLDHFSNSFIKPYQYVTINGASKDKYDKVELVLVSFAKEKKE
jgi:hypothetical protein